MENELLIQTIEKAIKEIVYRMTKAPGDFKGLCFYFPGSIKECFKARYKEKYPHDEIKDEESYFCGFGLVESIFKNHFAWFRAYYQNNEEEGTYEEVNNYCTNNTANIWYGCRLTFLQEWLNDLKK
jgi:hypothetical protein